MNQSRLIITGYNGAIVSIHTDPDGKTVRINAESDSKKSIVGNIYAGNVTDIVKGINAAFVEFENGQRGFLHLDGRAEPVFLNKRRNEGPLRQGDVILVRAEGDPVKEKDASVSADISIAGRYAVILPGRPGLKFSSKIKDEAFKSRIQELAGERPEQDGFIIRSAAASARPDLIIRDMERLSDDWQQALERAGSVHKGVVYRCPQFYISDIIEYAPDVSEIITDDAGCARNIQTFLKECYPEDAGKLNICNSLKSSVAAVYDVGRRVDEALKKKVYLKSGGYLVIEHTEALNVIDVNTGSAASPDFLSINIEAAREAARQIVLRNLSGMILIDFINMKNSEDNAALLSEMRDLLKKDPVNASVVDMTGLGIIEITRKKVRRPLYEIIDF